MAANGFAGGDGASVPARSLDPGPCLRLAACGTFCKGQPGGSSIRVTDRPSVGAGDRHADRVPAGERSEIAPRLRQGANDTAQKLDLDLAARHARRHGRGCPGACSWPAEPDRRSDRAVREPESPWREALRSRRRADRRASRWRVSSKPRLEVSHYPFSIGPIIFYLPPTLYFSLYIFSPKPRGRLRRRFGRAKRPTLKTLKTGN
jgi:hypothetical protein